MTTPGTVYDGPSMAQGTSGTWSVVGHVTVGDTTGGGGQFSCKLWDGTTVISSGLANEAGAFTNNIVIALEGTLASPAANIRISCSNSGSNGKIYFNASGFSKDSSIFGQRIQ